MIDLVLGLGNEGAEYDGSRHNVGFELLNRVATRLSAGLSGEEDHYRSARVKVARQPGDGGRLTLAWPTTLVNRSGQAAQALLNRLKLDSSQMLVILDDFNLPLGTLRFRAGGSGGGHNGLISIIEALDTDNFPRLRLGIGPPSDNESRRQFVLGRFRSEELALVEKMLAKACEAVIFAVTHRLEEAMSKYNRSPALPDEA